MNVSVTLWKNHGKHMYCSGSGDYVTALQRIQLPVSSETLYRTVFKKYGRSTKVVDLRMIKTRHEQAKRKGNNY